MTDAQARAPHSHEGVVRPVIPKPGVRSVRPVRHPDALVHPSLAASRLTLCKVLDALGDHYEAITIVGAHAVHERTRGLSVESTSTKDGDLAVTPGLVVDEPLIEQAMRDSGFRPLMEIAVEHPEGHPGRRWQGRPGLWGTSITDTGTPVDEVDLMVPESLAGKGRRSVKALAEHGKQAVGRVDGLELAVLERDTLQIADLHGGATRAAYVARHSGLVCAKAYKIVDRQRAVRKGQRERGLSIPKDAVDMWRCMATSDPLEVLDDFNRHLEDTVIGGAVSEGLTRFRGLLADGATAVIISRQLSGDGITEDAVGELFSNWRETFRL